MKGLVLVFIPLLFVFIAQANSTNNPQIIYDVPCNVLWQDVINGTCIGSKNNFIPYDIDNDGTPELITNAFTYGFDQYSSTGFWYVLKYTGELHEYEKIYVSSFYENGVRELRLADVDSDGDKELLFLSGVGIEIVDLNEFSTIHTIELDDFIEIFGSYQIRFDDADNDDVKEIIASNSKKIVFIDVSSFEIENTFQLEGDFFDTTGGDFAIGNVDDDEALETVFSHGLVLQFDSLYNFIEEFDFKPNDLINNNIIELSDFDSDNKFEAITGNSSGNIEIYIVEQQSLAYEIDTDGNFSALTMYDVNNDQVEDILFSDSWDDVYAYNSINGSLLWMMENPDSDVTGIAIADFDGDGQSEIVWGGGCENTGPDFLYVHDIGTQQLEWKSVHIDGPFYALEISDIDEDGELEIISLSYESNAMSSGTLTIYDAITKSIEFRSEENFFYQVLTGLYDFEIYDYGNDGDLEIIVAAGEGYNGKIWVVDGDNYNIEVEHLYPTNNNIDEFYTIEVDDIDNDGVEEFVCVSAERAYIINSLDFSIEWSSMELGGTSKPQNALIGNLDDDPEDEIVICKGYIYSFDDTDFTQLQTSKAVYFSALLYDWNNDGTMEVLAGSFSGELAVLDGLSLDIIETFAITDELIGGIEVADFNNDSIDELIITSNERIYFVTMDGNIINSQPIAEILGRYNSIEVFDYDNNGYKNILLGAKYGILDIDAECADCLWFDFELEIFDAICGEDVGKIIANSADPSIVYELVNEGITFTSSIDSLAAGVYEIYATNDFGCSKSSCIEIFHTPPLSAEFILKPDALPTPEFEGAIYVSVNEGTPSYDFSIDSVETTNIIQNLECGNYNINIIDAVGCELDTIIQVSPSGSFTGIFNVTEVKSFPNPNVGYFSIKDSSFSKKLICSLYTVDGKLIIKSFEAYRQEDGSFKFNFDKVVKSGIYYLLLQSSSKSYISRVSIIN